MVLGFALCATIAFAQTGRVATSNMAAKANAAANVEAFNPQSQAGYKASIFTKEVGDTLAEYHFANETGFTTGVYNSTNAAPATVEGRANHNQDGYFATWHRVDSADYEMNSAEYLQNYPSFSSSVYANFRRFVIAVMSPWAGWGINDSNGFMLMSCIDQTQMDVSKNFNAYIEFGPIDASSAAVVDLRFIQFYMKFYDTCYIDYTDAQGVWHSMEINVEGIDCEINEYSRGLQLYTLPLAAANNSSLKLRLRWYSKPYSARQAAYGYVWAIDDVIVRRGAASRLYTYYADKYVEGAYGQVPQSMQLPLSWYTPIKNNGSVAQTGIVAKTYSGTDKANLAVSATGNHADMPSNPGKIDSMIVEGRTSVAQHTGWLGYDPTYMEREASFTNNGLNTTETGLHYATTTITTDDENVTGVYDTILYRVTAPEDGLYTWSIDNGLFLAGNYFSAGYVVENGNTYTTDGNGGYTKAGYRVSNRYTTGNVIPTDTNGDAWVIRGVELVTAAVPQSRNYIGARISATLNADVFTSDGQSVYFYDSDIPLTTGDTIYLSTGAGVHQVTGSEVNTTYGYAYPGIYNTIRIMFHEQPELFPNMSYRIGYALEAEHAFAVAQTSTTYAETYTSDTTATWGRLLADTTGTLRQYGYQFAPNPYTTYLQDPTNADNPGRFAYMPDAPYIRMLVGPRVPVERKNIEFQCETIDVDGELVMNGGGRFRWNGQDSVCRTIDRAVGSSVSIDMVPFTDINAYKVDSVWVDGTYVEPYDAEADEGDPNLIIDYDHTRWIIDSTRNASGAWTYNYAHNYHEIYTYTFTNLQADHKIKAKYKYVPNGIDPVRQDASISIYPNPASSSATITIEGVTGKVSLSLIDMSGRVVLNKTVDAESVQNLNLNNLAKGAYFVRVTNDEFSKVEKLIVR